MVGNAQLLDCGHLDAMRAVCQFEGCAKRICQNCYVNCDGRSCGLTICRQHQVWREDRRKVFCPRCSTNYTLKKVARKLLFSGGSNDRSL